MWSSEITACSEDEITPSVCLGELVRRVEASGRSSWTDIPDKPGIYVVFVAPFMEMTFRKSAGTAKCANTTCPNFLQDKWDRISKHASTDILYIGKAGGEQNTLRKRIRNLARFGAGHGANHKGGEWMWQAKQICSAQVKFVCCQRGDERDFENRMLRKFRNIHGDLPLANRQE